MFEMRIVVHNRPSNPFGVGWFEFGEEYKLY